MNFLLFHPKTRPTGKKLARSLELKFGSRPPQDNVEVVVRWGNPRYRIGGTVINSSKAINLAGNKFKSLVHLSAAGIKIPRVSSNLKDLALNIRKDFVFGRSFRHSRGKDIVIMGPDRIPEADTVDTCDYFIEYVKPTKEYRIHVFVKTKQIFCQKKYFGEELFARLCKEKELTGEGIEEFRRISGFIRNNEHGWRFYDVIHNKNVPIIIRDAAYNAVESLGLDFGAVDIVLGEDGSEYLLEVNTAPGLREKNLVRYSKELSKLIGGELV